MNAGNRNSMQGSERRPVTRRARNTALSFLVLTLPLWGFGQRQRSTPPPARSAPMRPAPARPAPQNTRPVSPGNSGTLYRPVPSYAPGGSTYRPPNAVMRPGTSAPVRPGQEHLPEWMAQHQNLSPAQQQNLLRSEPGFNRLAPDQQQRVMNRLRSLDEKPPAERQRLMARQEMFERLSPEQRQDVRSSAQVIHSLPQDRQHQMTSAFNDLRRLPPDQRQAVLNSARFSHQFSPEERHVLGSLLSVEPYQPNSY
ncbi:MAG TPA: DUF3106 domain-containing protein [Acidobacteriaceae bacterium]|nr:DUF3106 domain-containing protein [Acidobacteriaceae bacterium]